MVWYGLEHGVVRPRKYGVVRHVLPLWPTAQYYMAQYCVALYCLVWYCMAWYRMTRLCMAM